MILLQMPFPELRRLIRDHKNDPLTPVTLRVAVHDDKVDYLFEHQDEFPGVQVKQTYIRSYNAGPLFAQGLGYVSEISADGAEAHAEGRLPRR